LHADFLQLTEALYASEGSTWKIALPRLYKLLYNVLSTELKIDEATLISALKKDFQKSNQKGTLEQLINKQTKRRTGSANKRQKKHQT